VTTHGDIDPVVIRVTPTNPGLLRATVTFAVVLGGGLWLTHFLGRGRSVAEVVIAVISIPFALRALMKFLRWRSHSIVITVSRVIFSGGMVRRRRMEFPIEQIVACHVEQGWWSRIIRRGELIVETAAGERRLGRVRHPAALVRVIEAQRQRGESRRVAYDTIFDPPNVRNLFNNPSPFDEDPYGR
jgi:uncharacterized membrane protein YdbT with pleckstrin-like domain